MKNLLWQLLQEGNTAIFFGILADGLAAIPTIAKSYKEPESEHWQAFFFGGLSAAITLLAIDSWDFAHYGFPLYIFGICMLLVALIKFQLGRKIDAQLQAAYTTKRK